jgi:Subunit 11 of the general transcription factor TFIIH
MTNEGGFNRLPPTPTSLASPPSSRSYLSSAEESSLISLLDEQLTKISSRVMKRHQPGGYISLHALSNDFFRLLQSLLTPSLRPFTVTQYLIRIVGDLNEYMEVLPPADDTRGIFIVLRKLDEAIAGRVGGMGQTERVRLRSEVERARGVVAKAFEGYSGEYEVEDAIGRVYENSLEELEEPFGVEDMVRSAEQPTPEEAVMEDEL